MPSRFLHDFAQVLHAEQPAFEFPGQPAHRLKQVLAPLRPVLVFNWLKGVQQGPGCCAHLAPLFRLRAKFQQDQLGTFIPGPLEEFAYAQRDPELLQLGIDHAGRNPLRLCGPGFSLLGFDGALRHSGRARQVPLGGGRHSGAERLDIRAVRIEAGDRLLYCAEQLLAQGLTHPTQPHLPAHRRQLQAIQHLVQWVASGHQKIRVGDRQLCCQGLKPSQFGLQGFFEGKICFPVNKSGPQPVQYRHVLCGGHGGIANGLGLGLD